MRLACALLITAFSAVSSAQAPVLEAPYDAADAWNTGQAERRRLQMQEQGLVIAKRVQAQEQRADARNAAQYAENRRRCAAALRIAELCGKYAGTFYCDEKGFQPIPEAERVGLAVPDSSRKHKMEQCALKAARK